jgi:hypothetical protein
MLGRNRPQRVRPPEQAQAVVYSQIDQWVDVVKKTGIKLQ